MKKQKGTEIQSLAHKEAVLIVSDKLYFELKEVAVSLGLSVGELVFDIVLTPPTDSSHNH
jgi:tmRNA-binding protein